MTEPHERWLDKAEDDLRFAELGLKEGFYSQVCFLSQQAAEKSLKAYLVFKGEVYPKTHKLTDLGSVCAKLSGNFSKFFEDFRILDEFYIPTRYPDAAPGSLKDSAPSKKRAEEALKIAHKVLSHTKTAVTGK